MSEDYFEWPLSIVKDAVIQALVGAGGDVYGEFEIPLTKKNWDAFIESKKYNCELLVVKNGVRYGVYFDGISANFDKHVICGVVSSFYP